MAELNSTVLFLRWTRPASSSKEANQTRVCPKIFYCRWAYFVTLRPKKLILEQTQRRHLSAWAILRKSMWLVARLKQHLLLFIYLVLLVTHHQGFFVVSSSFVFQFDCDHFWKKFIFLNLYLIVKTPSHFADHKLPDSASFGKTRAELLVIARFVSSTFRARPVLKH